MEGGILDRGVSVGGSAWASATIRYPAVVATRTPESIESLDDPRVADYRNVRDADLRAPGLFVAEGRLNVERLVRDSRHPVRSVFVTPAAWAAMRGCLEGLPAPVPIYSAPQSVLDGVVGYPMHRGCLAVGERLPEQGLDGVLEVVGDGPALLLLLEDVSNADNVGGVFRNAMAFGVDAVLLTPRCVDPLYRKSVRVSMGGSLVLPFARVAAGVATLEKLRAADFCVAALATDSDAIALSAWRPQPPAPERVVLVLGAEGPGLSAATREAADLRLRIPMARGADSLNLYSAAAIAIHHLTAVLRGSVS